MGDKLALAEPDWRRVARRTMVGALVAVGLIQLYRFALGGTYGFDFHGGSWVAGWDVLHGRNPYPASAHAATAASHHAFFTPPLLALLAVPFSVLPFPLAITLWTALSAAALVLALRLLGVRDLRLYALAMFSVPLLDCFEAGQPDALLALLAALAWRFRGSDRGAVAVGVLIAAKLLAWPLLVWMFVTRRFRSARMAVGSAAATLIGSWACIGFHGLADYPALLAADAKAVERWPTTPSLTHALLASTGSVPLSLWLTVLIAVAVGALSVWMSGGSDEGWFGSALVVGLLASPILWLHYLTILFVPIAIGRRRALWIWAAAAYSFWLVLIVAPSGGARAWAVCVTAGVIAIWATSSRPGFALRVVDWTRMRNPMAQWL